MGQTRKFDYDKAKRMRKRGMTYRAIGLELGVSATAVDRVCNPDRRNQMDMLSAAYQRSGVCVDCGAQCSYNASDQRRGVRKGRCRACDAKAKATTVRDDGLYCSSCREWKWDTEFPFNSSKRCDVRRGRHQACRVCLTEMKRQWRERNPEKEREANRRSAEQRRQRKAAAR